MEHTTSIPCADVLTTQNHEVIRHWAELRQAEPALGDDPGAGTASRQSRDTDIRFNVPGGNVSPAITWDEWFRTFDEHELTFVYDTASAERPGSSYKLLKRPDWNDIVR